MGSNSEQPFVSERQLSRQDFEGLASDLGHKPLRARKIGYVAASQAKSQQRVDTLWNGRESTNLAEPGDWVVTNLAPDRQPLRDEAGHLNCYVIRADKFPSLYEPVGTSSEVGPVFKARASVQALRMPAGFDILAPWGERQRGAAGYLILNGEEVYGIAIEPFDATYELLPD